MKCECFHFIEADDQPYGKRLRVWLCIDCGELKLLKHSVWEWVRMNYGKWQCKIKEYKSR